MTHQWRNVMMQHMTVYLKKNACQHGTCTLRQNGCTVPDSVTAYKDVKDA